MAALMQRHRQLKGIQSVSDDDIAIDLRFDLEPPDDHRKDYERAIGMLKLHQAAGEDAIHITPQLYAAYMQDIWGWEEEFWSKNVTMYGVARPRRRLA